MGLYQPNSFEWTRIETQHDALKDSQEGEVDPIEEKVKGVLTSHSGFGSITHY